MASVAPLRNQNPYLGSHEIYNFVEGFMVFLNIQYVFSQFQEKYRFSNII